MVSVLDKLAIVSRSSTGLMTKVAVHRFFEYVRWVSFCGKIVPVCIWRELFKTILLSDHICIPKVEYRRSRACFTKPANRAAV